VIGARHPILGRLRRLSRQRAARTDERAYVIDGPTLLDEAVAAGVPIEEVVAEPDAPDALLDRVRAAGATVHQAAAGALAKAVATVTPQPVAAVARFQDLSVSQVLDRLAEPSVMLVLVGVNDPGNAGTLLRSAEAAGLGAVVFCDDSVDPYNPKCVRASSGSLFRLPVVRDAVGIDAVRLLQERGVVSLGTVAQGGVPYDEIAYVSPTAIVLGNEANGLPEAIQSRLDQLVTIPMQPPVESLNVAMAGTLLAFEAARQFRRKALDVSPARGAGFNPR
jgi:TrmH family RNA methyltransferase